MAATRNIGHHPLAEYDWNERTGVALLTYPDLVVVRDQPMNPSHRGWSEHGQRKMIAREDVGILGMIGERLEAQIENLDADYCWQYI